jgi:predicted nucleic acid-binding protein/transcriptional regulator with XRE-family HTH domain
MTTSLAPYKPAAPLPTWRRLGEALGRVRRRHPGLSLKELSGRAQLSETYYGMIERGTRRPHYEVLNRLLDVLGVTGRERRTIEGLLRKTHYADVERRAGPSAMAERSPDNGVDAEGRDPTGGLASTAAAPTLVVDASVLVKPFTRHDEADRAKSLTLLRRHADRRNRIAVPECGRFEIMNAIRFSRHADQSQTAAALRALDRFGLDFVVLTASAFERAVALSWERGVSVYDAAYVALAEMLEAPLITADAKLSTRLRGHPLLRLLGDFEVS